MYRNIKKPEAYYKAFGRMDDIRQYCKDNKIYDYKTLLEKCIDEKPEWMRTITRPSVIGVLDRFFTSEILSKKRKEIMAKEGPNTRKSRKVKCLETGQVFRSLTAAAEFVGVKNTREISDVCRGIRESIRGYRFEYIDDASEFNKEN